MAIEWHFIVEVSEAFIHGALRADGPWNDLATFLAFLKSFQCCLLLTLLSSSTHNDEALPFENSLLQKVKFLFRCLLGQMVLIELCERSVLITRHFYVDTSIMTLERVKALMILLYLLVKFMSLHFDSRKIYRRLLGLLRLLLLVRSHLGWIVHGWSSHCLLSLNRLYSWWVGHTSCLPIRLLSLQTALLHGIPLLSWRNTSHDARPHHSSRSLRIVNTWDSDAWLPLRHPHWKILR